MSASTMMRSSSRTFLQAATNLGGGSAVRSVFSLSGVYPRVVNPELVTRHNKHGNGEHKEEIDFDRFTNILRHLDRYPIAGYVLQSPLQLTDNMGDYFRLITRARQFLNFHRIIIATTPDDIDSINTAASAGADAALVFSTLHHFSDGDFVYHFNKIASHSRIPIILHNAQPYHNTGYSVDAICELAKHRNIVGLLEEPAKNDGISRLSTICMKTKAISTRENPFDVVTASAASFLPSLVAGSSGLISPLVNVLPFEVWSIRKFYRKGQIQDARILQWRLMEADEIVSDMKTGDARIKAVLDLCLGVHISTRKDQLMSNSDEADRIIGAFQQFGLSNKK